MSCSKNWIPVHPVSSTGGSKKTVFVFFFLGGGRGHRVGSDDSKKTSDADGRGWLCVVTYRSLQLNQLLSGAGTNVNERPRPTESQIPYDSRRTNREFRVLFTPAQHRLHTGSFIKRQASGTELNNWSSSLSSFICRQRTLRLNEALYRCFFEFFFKITRGWLWCIVRLSALLSTQWLLTLTLFPTSDQGLWRPGPELF